MAISIYADALVLNHTVKNRKAATINGEQVGVSKFAAWKNACNTAFEAFYRYQKNCVDVAIGTESKADTTAAFSALQTILDLIGEVNGHSLTKSLEMLTILSSYAVKDKNEYAGEALTVSSNLKDLRKSLKNVHTGMNEEYVRSLERQIAEAEEYIRRTISSEFFEALLEGVRSKKLSITYSMLVHELKLAVAGWLHGNTNVLRMKLSNIVNEMEKHIDDYPEYKNSEAYKVKHFERYQNGKDDTTYFFG